MWTKYESIIIFTDELDAEHFTKEYLRTRELIGEITKTKVTEEVIGKKKLAYTMKSREEGWYVRYEFYATSDNIRELDRIFRLNDYILKFINVKKEADCYSKLPKEYEQITPEVDALPEKIVPNLRDILSEDDYYFEKKGDASGKSEQSSAEDTKPKKYVWTVLFKWTWEDGDGNVTVNVFNSRESAMEYWKHLVKDEQAEYATSFSDSDSYEQSENKTDTRAEFNIWVVDSNERSQIILERKEVQ